MPVTARAKCAAGLAERRAKAFRGAEAAGGAVKRGGVSEIAPESGGEGACGRRGCLGEEGAEGALEQEEEEGRVHRGWAEKGSGGEGGGDASDGAKLGGVSSVEDLRGTTAGVAAPVDVGKWVMDNRGEERSGGGLGHVGDITARTHQARGWHSTKQELGASQARIRLRQRWSGGEFDSFNEKRWTPEGAPQASARGCAGNGRREGQQGCAERRDEGAALNERSAA